jgi:hypothetical protein
VSVNCTQIASRIQKNSPIHKSVEFVTHQAKNAELR